VERRSGKYFGAGTALRQIIVGHRWNARVRFEPERTGTPFLFFFCLFFF